MKHVCFVTLVLAAVAVSAASAQDRTINLTVAAGKVGEICIPLQAGDTLAWRFESSAAADFNLHDHVGKQVNMPVQRKAVRRARAQHTLERTNEWCLTWTAPHAKGITVTGSWQVKNATPR